MGLDVGFGTAFAKSQIGAGSRLPRQGNVLITVKNNDKDRAVAIEAATEIPAARRRLIG